MRPASRRSPCTCQGVFSWVEGKPNVASHVLCAGGEMRTLTVGMCLATAIGSAQQPSTPTQSWNFEVATLKQNNSGERGGGIRRLPGGRVTVTNMPARALVTFAYQLGQYQL